ncbi:MAG: porin [Adhaeribacter sp.]
MSKLLCGFIPLFLLCFSPVSAQEKSMAEYQDEKGISLAGPDSSFTTHIRFRMQGRAMYHSVSKNDFDAAAYEMRIRRLRLRFGGFIYSPKLTYNIQLSFSRGDMDWSGPDNSNINTSPNVVRDAAVSYEPNDHWTFVFGQTKLPGNRQRVISSGDQQFIDRSVVNGTFTVDRDFGIHAYYQNNIGSFIYQLKTAVSTGEGRNVTSTPPGLAYTGRVELLPLGAFSHKGDYFEGDLAREQTVKLSLAGGMSFNDNARKTGGQLGDDLFAPRDIRTYMLDGVLKYRGMAFSAEHIARDVNNPLTIHPVTGDISHILTGNGQNFQLSYLFKNNLEVAGRYSRINPADEVRALDRQQRAYIAGLTQYLRGHRLKLQANVGYHNSNTYISVNRNYHWTGGVQIELGI